MTINSYGDLGKMPKRGDLMIAVSNSNNLPLTIGKVYEAATDAGDATFWGYVFVVNDNGSLQSCSVENFFPFESEGRGTYMGQKLPIEAINELAHKLPTEVLQDINQRMMDWKVSGGEDDDPYMYQQLRYANHVASRLEEVR